MEQNQPPKGLFEKIIAIIRKEEDLRKAKRILLGFIMLFIISSFAVPLSWTIVKKQAESTGFIYFVSTATKDLGIFTMFWKDFLIAIAESLPFGGIAAFTASLGIAIFTLRLFLFRKKMLLKYLFSNNLMESFTFAI